ncbi:MAG TPA: hypothetical protein DCR14_15110, partial [Acidimicrobiaceae bacterium]|nr:hypothetical protein [Acidimicrobiaceae bacterium]
GAFTKSAQQPFGSWLPGAMVAPTPVSAYLHSATMVKAGVYLVARMSPAFAEEGSWRVLTVTVGLVTMIIGGYRALRQTDLKLLLAMGTTSQLGLLIALFGLGLPEVTQAAIALLVAHAVFKSALFMVVGIIDHELGTRDVRQVAIGGPGWRTVQVVAVVGAISMAGAPPVLGFVAKELVVHSLLHERHAVVGGVVILAVVLLGSVLTFAYSGRFVLGVLGHLREAGDPHAADAHAHDDHHGHTPHWYFIAPAALLTVVTLVLGLHADLFTRMHTAASKALHPLADVPYLALWHGVNAALLWSLAVMAVGTVLVVLRRQVAALQRHRLRGLSTERGYLALLKGLNRLANRVAAVVQSGSLPLYVAIIMAVATGVPLIGLLAGDGWVELPQWVDLPVHLAIALVLVVGAVATTVLRRRFAAVLLLGSVGYGMAAFFVAQGAPDLALTQFAIETLGVVLFVLVLRALPEESVTRQPRPIRLARGVVAALVGVFVFVFALAMSQARVADPISSEFVERSVPEGKGGNVVNVILVDFRGLDTLGEITVLAVAAVGALGLVRAGARRPVSSRNGKGG